MPPIEEGLSEKISSAGYFGESKLAKRSMLLIVTMSKYKILKEIANEDNNARISRQKERKENTRK